MAIDVTPRFTLSLRGYDKDEVDEYLESLSAHTVEVDARIGEYEERYRRLDSERQRLLSRIAELEAAIRSETPHTVRALGERITLILSEAEAGAEETLAQARARADYVIAEAQDQAETLRRQASMAHAQANETLAGAQRQAEDLAARIESEAKSRAAVIVADAEGRARRRQEQIESWAQEVITRTQADQARMTEEFAAIRRRHESDVAELASQRDEVLVTLRTLQRSLGRAVERATPVSAPASGAPIELDAVARADAAGSPEASGATTAPAGHSGPVGSERAVPAVG
jgi:cell division septum initiation protein DivIVA